jgi:intracellular sulfur oxidation DsrE/DsrF family protein
MKHLTRRAFVSGAAAVGMAASGSKAAEGQLVWKTTDWNPATFQALVKHPARVKQVYDITKINDGMFLNNVKNSLNGLAFGFGVPAGEIKIAVAMHGPANMLNYDDSIWSKYQIGEWLKVTDPETGKPAVRNIFVGKDEAAIPGAAAQNPDNRDSMYQAKDIATLRHRGVRFLSCHTATEEQARALVRMRNLSTSPEEIVKDMLSHAIEGTIVVPSMVAAIALLQVEGRFSYITIA